MYRNYYMQASQMADMIQSGALADQKSAQRKSQQEGLMNRISSRVEEDSGFDVTKYISNMRSTLKKEAPAVEGGSVTGMAVPDIEELPEGTVRPKAKAAQGEIVLGEAPDSVSKGYPISQKGLEQIIIREAKLRNIDPSVAVAIFRSEGAGAYQSQIKRSGKGSLGGKEASFGPFQLYTGGGLGNQYEKQTGRSLIQDNTEEGLIKQIQFSLDAAVDSGWTPWYGRKTAGVSERQGLSEARKIGNWK